MPELTVIGTVKVVPTAAFCESINTLTGPVGGCGVEVGVLLGVAVGGTAVAVAVAVLVGIGVAVLVGVAVAVAVAVLVGVGDGVAVEGTAVSVAVAVGVLVDVAAVVAVGVAVLGTPVPITNVPAVALYVPPVVPGGRLIPFRPGIFTFSNVLIEVPLVEAVNTTVPMITSEVVVHDPPSGTPNGALAKAVTRPFTLSIVPRFVNCVSIDNELPSPSTHTTLKSGLSIVQNAAFGEIERTCTTLGLNARSNCRPRIPVPALILIGTEKFPPTARVTGSITANTGKLGMGVAVGGTGVAEGGTGVLVGVGVSVGNGVLVDVGVLVGKDVFVAAGVGVFETPVPTTKFPNDVENVLVAFPSIRLIPFGPGIFTF